MIYKIVGGIFFILLGIDYLNLYAVPNPLLGVLALVAGIALIAGV